MLVYLLIPILIMLFGADTRLIIILIAVFGVLIPMALAQYAVSSQFSQAFNLGEIFQNLARVAHYYLLSYLAVVIVLALAAYILLHLPMLAVISAFLLFYTGVVHSNYIGRLYHRATSE